MSNEIEKYQMMMLASGDDYMHERAHDMDDFERENHSQSVGRETHFKIRNIMHYFAHTHDCGCNYSQPHETLVCNR